MTKTQKATWHIIAKTGTDVWHGLAEQAKKDDAQLSAIMQNVAQAMSAVATYLKSRLEES